MQGYYTWLGVYVCSIINFSLFLSHLSLTILILVMHTLLYLSPHSVPPLFMSPPPSLPLSSILSIFSNHIFLHLYFPAPLS